MLWRPNPSLWKARDGSTSGLRVLLGGKQKWSKNLELLLQIYKPQYNHYNIWLNKNRAYQNEHIIDILMNGLLLQCIGGGPS